MPRRRGRLKTSITLGGRRIYSSAGIITTKQVTIQPDSVLVVPLLSGGDVLMIRQYRALVNGNLLELPGGRIMKGEKPEEAARRELREETGYTCGSLRRLFSFHRAPSYSTQTIHVFLADGLRQESPESDEWSIDIERIKLSEVPDLIRRGELVDGKTICALLYVLIWVDR